MRKTIEISAVLALTLLAATVAGAHGGRVDFASWGPFAAGAAHCQRGIARAAATCARDSWEQTRACRDAQGTGTPCNTALLGERIQAVRLAALDAVDAACSERQAQDLGYLGLFDLQADTIDFCRAWTTAATSAVYGDRVAAGDEGNACTRSLAEATSRLLAFVFRERRRCMETIAAKTVDADQREVLLARTTAGVDRYTAGLAAAIAPRCNAQDFSARYGRAAAELLATVASRADCLAAAVYIQDRILCATAICGNGVIEPGEVCDDGDARDGGGCSADCADKQ